MCFWVAALAVQYYFLFNALWMGVLHKKWDDIRINTTKLIFGEVSAGAILIAVCAVIGKTTSVQYFILTIAGSFLYTLNEIIVIDELKVRDVGGAMIIHTFGAFYGIGLTTVYRYKDARGNKNLYESHDSLTSAMIGTLFLWCFWPSFNAALAPSDVEIHMAVLNSYFSIIGSVISAYGTSVLLGDGRFAMSQILNATLAGGVAMGSCADILYDGWAAYFVGSLVGIISTVCFKYCPGILDKCGIHDVAGVFNLHGIPGLISGFISAIFRAKYIDNKGGNQAAATVISCAIGLFGGLIVGLLTKCFHNYEGENDFFNDKAVVALEDFVVEELEKYGHPLPSDTQRKSSGQIHCDIVVQTLTDHRAEEKVQECLDIPIESEIRKLAAVNIFNMKRNLT
jgi:ammonium transporter Rh